MRSGPACCRPSCPARCGGARCSRRSGREGVGDFVELGPGGVLTGMAKRTDRRCPHLVGRHARTISTACSGSWPRRRARCPPVVEGEHLFATERLVVSPAAGVFAPIDGLRGGSPHRHRPGARPRRRARGALGVRGRAAGVHRGPRRAGHEPPADRLAEDGLTCPEYPQGSAAPSSPGGGIAVPDKVVTNDDLAATMDTSDAWITERTGIRERRVGGTTSGLATEAAQAAIAKAGVAPVGHRRPDPRHHHPRPDRAGHQPHGPEEPRPRVRRDRHQRRLLGLRVRPGHGPRPHRGRQLEDPGHRGRDAVADHRLERPRHGHPVRRRRRRGRARGRRRRPGSAAVVGPRTPTAPPSRSCTPTSATT